LGGGYFDTNTYTRSSVTRRSAGVSDFQYSEENLRRRIIAPELDPARIRTKPFGKLESRDNADHPESNPVFVMFDVTGSNKTRAIEAQKKLPDLMNILTGTDTRPGYLRDPQILIAANDDFHVEGKMAFQVSDYESDNRIDEMIRKILLVGNGGGNNGESYDLGMYCAARKTILDSMEKRNKKGYFFMYADEPLFPVCSRRHIQEIFGDNLEAHIPIADLITELKQLYNVYVMWPVGGYDEAYQQFVALFGENSVLTLQHPNMICQLIGSVIGFNEGRVRSATQLQDDLAAAGVSQEDIASVTSTLALNRSITFEAA